MYLSLSQWHIRYQQQAEWTHNIREYIYNQTSLITAQKILDVGCGTGVLENELSSLTSSNIYALDIDSQAIKYAKVNAPHSVYIAGNSSELPYCSGIFDITLCHFLLLWVGDAAQAVKEMARVTRPKGFVLALAEPDYGGRIDYPSDLLELGKWQTESLVDQGANPFIGRELRAIFSKAGLVNIEVGIVGGQWGESDSDKDFDLEWQVIQSDLASNHEFRLQADILKRKEILSRHNYERILFIPTFYAFGMVKEEV